MEESTHTIPTNINFKLNNKIILITGATDGIGKALAKKTAKLGAKIILHGRNKKKLELLSDDIAADKECHKPSIALLDFEIADLNSYIKLSDDIHDNFNRLDGLVHCAGILGDKTPIEQYKPEVWQKVLHVNLTAPFVLTQALFGVLKLSDSPSVIFTSSNVSKIAKPFWGAYSVSKFGIEALSQILAHENDHIKMRVNTINPGAVNTKMRLQAYPAEDRDHLKNPEDILHPYLYFLSDESIGSNYMSLDAQY